MSTCYNHRKIRKVSSINEGEIAFSKNVHVVFRHPVLTGSVQLHHISDSYVNIISTHLTLIYCLQLYTLSYPSDLHSHNGSGNKNKSE